MKGLGLALESSKQYISLGGKSKHNFVRSRQHPSAEIKRVDVSYNRDENHYTWIKSYPCFG